MSDGDREIHPVQLSFRITPETDDFVRSEIFRMNGILREDRQLSSVTATIQAAVDYFAALPEAKREKAIRGVLGDRLRGKR